MKILIAAENAELISDVVQKQGHAVVDQTADSGQLFDLILKHTPHLVFVEKANRTTQGLEQLQSVFWAVRFVLLGFQRGTSWTQTIRQALRKGPANVPWRPELPEERQVILDPRYYSCCSSANLKHLSNNENARADTAVEALRLSCMLRTARRVRKQARLYADASACIDSHEWQEIVFRTLHGSFKAPVYARQQLGRALGYLSHFVPGADLHGLPQPVDQPANFRYLHHVAPPENHYALFCVTLFGCNFDLAKELYRATHWRYEGEASQDLAAVSVMLTGLAFTLQQVARNQSVVVGWLLDKNTATRLNEPRARPVRCAIQSFTDWWNLRHIMNNEHRLRAVLDDLHDNPEESPLPENLRLPRFAQFLEAMKASKNETQPNQT